TSITTNNHHLHHPSTHPPRYTLFPYTTLFRSSDLRPLTAGNENDNSPRWSPDGQRLLYASTSDGAAQIYVRWMDSGQIAKVTRRSEEHTSELQSRFDLVCRLLLEKKKKYIR